VLPPDVVVARHDPCSWVPEGGVAEVVRTAVPAPPRPTSIVRLLATCAGAILVAPRADGRGVDIPAAAVGADGEVESVLSALADDLLDGAGSPRLVGFVRNTVPGPAADYPWPVPVAHFAVWWCEVERRQARRGHWLGAAGAADQLAERHWWPLAAHLPG
jgi:hypothetical protein